MTTKYQLRMAVYGRSVGLLSPVKVILNVQVKLLTDDRFVFPFDNGIWFVLKSAKKYFTAVDRVSYNVPEMSSAAWQAFFL